jgi:hypothetical protein
VDKATDVDEIEEIEAIVTAENIAERFALRDDNDTDCLVARALREATGDVWKVGVTRAVRVGDAAVFTLDRKTSEAIGNWVDDDEVKPFKFTARRSLRQDYGY